MDPMQPVQSCPMPEKPNGVLGQTLLGNPCKLTSPNCQNAMIGNPPAGQVQAFLPNNKDRVKPPLSSQASASSISISRPRPTALPNKSAIKASRPPEPSLQVKATGTFIESPIPLNPQLSPTSHLNPPSIPPTLPSPPAQPVRANTHNNFITRPNPNLPSSPSPQPTQSPEMQIPSTGEGNNKLNHVSGEEGDFR